MSKPKNTKSYWETNIKVASILLAIWFTVSFVFGILLVDELNKISWFGFKLGFWWAQQGSIFVFVILIFVYSKIMKKVEKQFDLEDKE
tara:strand:- start:1738 stop:2001 length:264 start_codon:yes stop_codon:yes gene_type:complete